MAYEVFNRNNNQDSPLAVSMGKISGKRSVLVKGYRSVGATSTQPLNIANNLGQILAAATTVRIKAGGDINDTAAGSGAQSIIVEGTDANGAIITETIVTAGASASTATTASFRTIETAYVATAGAGATNTGTIAIENGAGGTDIMSIEAGRGESEGCIVQVPVGKVGFLHPKVHIGSNNLDVDVRIYKRTAAGIKRIIGTIAAASGTVIFDSLPQIDALEAVFAEATNNLGSASRCSIVYGIDFLDL